MQSEMALSQTGDPRAQGHDRWLGIPIVAWLIPFATAANLPFVNQPYHMDDGVYLLVARNVQHNPWFPQDFPFFFEGLYASDLASGEHAWPLTSYFAALISLVGGYKEAWLHLGFLLFPVSLAWGMYSLSADLTRHPALATVTLLMLPVIAVSSHTLMTDIPLLALWLTAVVLFRRGLASGSAVLLWAGLCLLVRVVGHLLQGFRELRKQSELNAADLFLAMWAVGVVIFCIAVHMTGSARHLLPAMPPLVLILFRLIEQRWDHLAQRLAVANLALRLGVAALFIRRKEYRSRNHLCVRGHPGSRWLWRTVGYLVRAVKRPRLMRPCLRQTSAIFNRVREVHAWRVSGTFPKDGAA
jgi:4-amino-4-deoxy-L-arabinose transferase-like glycosyltransferase